MSTPFPKNQEEMNATHKAQQDALVSEFQKPACAREHIYDEDGVYEACGRNLHCFDFVIHASEDTQNIHIEHCFPKGYNPDKEPWKSIKTFHKSAIEKAMKEKGNMNDRLEQLKQLRKITWDGNLMSKSNRDALYDAGLVHIHNGWNWLSVRGVEYLIVMGELKP